MEKTWRKHGGNMEETEAAEQEKRKRQIEIEKENIQFKHDRYIKGI